MLCGARRVPSRARLAAEELCQFGHAPEFADDIDLAHEALVELDARHSAQGVWTLDAAQHARLCTALAVFAEQLEDASLEHIAQAEASMVTQSLVAANMRSGIGRAQLASAS